MKVYEINMDGPPAETEIPWITSEKDGIDKVFKNNGYRSRATYGEENGLECTVYENSERQAWLFDLWDFHGRVVTLLATNRMAYYRALKDTSEACVAFSQASQIHESYIDWLNDKSNEF